MLRVITAFLVLCGASAYNRGAVDTITRRKWLAKLGAGAASIAVAQPVLALRSVLDEESQALFDEKRLAELAPPPPSKSIQETFGVDRPKNAPKYERVADKRARENYEAKMRAAGKME